MNAASEPTTPQLISQPAGTSPIISPGRRRGKIPSASAAKPQAGTTSISPASSPRDYLHPIPLGRKRRKSLTFLQTSGSESPLIAPHALAGVVAHDVREFAFEGCGPREAVTPLQFGGRDPAYRVDDHGLA